MQLVEVGEQATSPSRAEVATMSASPATPLLIGTTTPAAPVVPTAVHRDEVGHVTATKFAVPATDCAIAVGEAAAAAPANGNPTAVAPNAATVNARRILARLTGRLSHLARRITTPVPDPEWVTPGRPIDPRHHVI
jgi:hypothetical protein